MNKHAYYIGKTRALGDMGLSESFVKTALLNDGLSNDEADYFVKEAFWGGVAAGAGRLIGGLLLGGGRALAKRSGPALAKALKAGEKGGVGSRLMNWFAPKMRSSGKAFFRAGRGMEKDPWGTLGRGALETGKGVMMQPAKGLGGGLGKGAVGLSMASMLMPSGGGQMAARAAAPAMQGAYRNTARQLPNYGRYVQ